MHDARSPQQQPRRSSRIAASRRERRNQSFEVESLKEESDQTVIVSEPISLVDVPTGPSVSNELTSLTLIIT